jgi:murein DD-endopeptidase MepM/ murein hydrolase activator NlpD
VKLGRLLRFGRQPDTSTGPRDSWSLEIQIHPSDIRRRVVYLFLTRAQVTAWSLLALQYLLFLVLAAAVAPSVLSGWIHRGEAATLMVERTRQGERLQELTNHLARLGHEADGLDLRMQKVYLAYGLQLRRGAGRRPLPPSQGGAEPPGAEPRPVLTPGSSPYAGPIAQGERLRQRIDRRLAALNAALAEIQAYEKGHPELVRSTPSLSPVRGEDVVLTSAFGRRRSAFTNEVEVHAGLDLAAPVGTPVHAPADGTVLFAGEFPMNRSPFWWRFGNLVVLRNGDRFVTLFGHCEEVRVRAGQSVRKGDVLATVGNTGWSRSPHLHYEVRRRGDDGRYVPVEPMIHMLDQRWPNEERFLAQARRGRRRESFEPPPPVAGLQ